MKNVQPLGARIMAELDHIPRGDIYQNVFRSQYYTARFEDLVANSTTPAIETVRRVSDRLRKVKPGFVPIYDDDVAT